MIPEITTQQLFDEFNQWYLIDIREPEEYDLGVIPGARCIPMDDLPEFIGELALSPKPIAIICHSGRRSVISANILIRLGLSSVSVKGGMREWAGPLHYPPFAAHQ